MTRNHEMSLRQRKSAALRGWSYSSARRPKQHGAIRVSGRRRRPRWPLMVVALPALLIASVAAFASVGGGSTPGIGTPVPPDAAALLPVATEAPTQLAELAPTRPPTLVEPTPPATAPATAEPATQPTSAPTATMESILPQPMAPPTLAPSAAVELVPNFTLIGPQRSMGIFPDHRILSFYGNPLAKQMGILGEIPADQMLDKLKQQIVAYSAQDPSRPFVPALELVTPAAQGWPGDDGLYRARMKPEVIEQVAGWAEANHALLILDVQIGLSTVPEEVEALRPYLKRPYVHLALDPEFAIPSGHIPGEVVGTLDAAAIDGAERTLSELVATQHLPPKVLIVHRFTDSMVTNSWAISHRDPNVQIVVTMDGFGAPPLKLAQYRSYVHDQGVQFSGIKLFYHHDVPMLTPGQVLALQPSPDLVIYQ